MKFGMTSLTFRNCTVEDTLAIAKRAGVEGIEWGVSDLHVNGDENIEKIKKISAEYGIEIFSLGSYCYLDDIDHCMETVDLARKLSAGQIRIWAGRKSPCDVDETYFNMIVENTQKMADEAAKYGIVLGFEYHHHSLTETAESTVKLVKAVGKENVKTYWQPSGTISVEDNLKNLDTIKDYLSGIFHVQNYSSENGYMLIADIKDRVKELFAGYKDKDFNLLVEFTKDASEENLTSDINTLKEALA